MKAVLSKGELLKVVLSISRYIRQCQKCALALHVYAHKYSFCQIRYVIDHLLGRSDCIGSITVRADLLALKVAAIVVDYISYCKSHLKKNLLSNLRHNF